MPAREHEWESVTAGTPTIDTCRGILRLKTASAQVFWFVRIGEQYSMCHGNIATVEAIKEPKP